MRREPGNVPSSSPRWSLRPRGIDFGPVPEPPSRPVWISGQMTPLNGAAIYAMVAAPALDG